MEWIVEHTAERLVVELGSWFPHNATCVFDKATGRARFERQLFFFSRRTIDVPLADIVGFEVVEVEKPFDSYDLRVVLASGRRFFLSPAVTREETREVARQVREFLGLPQPSGEATSAAPPGSPSSRSGGRARTPRPPARP
jgi:hypothetical protein